MIDRLQQGVKVVCCSCSKIAYVNYFSRSTITFCPKYFAGNNQRDQAKWFLHELSHSAMWTRDYNYSWEPDEINKAPDDAYYIEDFMHQNTKLWTEINIWVRIWPAQ